MNKRSNIFFIAIISIILIIAIILIMNIMNPNKGELIALNYKQLKEKIDKKEDFILVISQSTCTHCASYKPKLKIIAKKYNIDIYYIDYDIESEKNQKQFLSDFDLDGSTPITIFIKNGKQTNLFDRIEGDVSQEKAISKFKKMGFIK